MFCCRLQTWDIMHVKKFCWAWLLMWKWIFPYLVDKNILFLFMHNHSWKICIRNLKIYTIKYIFILFETIMNHRKNILLQSHWRFIQNFQWWYISRRAETASLWNLLSYFIIKIIYVNIPYPLNSIQQHGVIINIYIYKE